MNAAWRWFFMGGRALPCGVALLLMGCTAMKEATMTRAVPDPTAAAQADPAAWLSNPLGMSDATFRVETRHTWDAGTFEQAALDGSGRLVLDVPAEAYPATGSWTSPVVRAGHVGLPAGARFTQFVPSFNVDAPKDTGVRVLLRVWRGEAETILDDDELVQQDDRWVSGWSPWLDLDGWGENRRTGRGSVTRFVGGRVSVDWIELDAETPADAYQVRMELVSFDTTHANAAPVSPAVRRLQIVASSPIAAEALAAHPSRVAMDLASVDPIDHAVPYFRQAANGPALGPRTCSPTCTSMVLKFFGHDVDPRLVSEAIYDRRYGLFGNWPRAAAYAGTYGHRATIERFRSWQDLEETLHAGSPVIASIRFEEGTFPSNRMRRTNGHLIVIRGLDDNGDAIVNDPAFADGSGERVILKADELARAWLGTGGIGYVVAPQRD